MLLNLKLTNFRKHKSLEIMLSDGLNVLRAMNEGGKSSVLEACSYALFGAKSLRTSLDDAVTWGEPTNSLKVELTVRSSDTTYVFARGKTGAEVVVDAGVFVTGQTEVSNFAAQLLGADLNLANKLMFSGQGNLRAALEEGPKALSVLIEDLAGFGTFDQILEAAQSKLALGSPTLIEERLKGGEATLAAATQNLPAKPDADALAETKAGLTADIVATEQSMPELEKVANDASVTHGEAATLYLAKRDIEQKLDAANVRLREAEAQAAKLKPAASVQIDTSSVDHLKALIAEADNYNARVAAFKKFMSLSVGVHFEGTHAEFEVASSYASGRKKEITDKIASLTRAVAELKAKRINADTCDKCGQDITHLPHVRTTNAEVDEMLGPLLQSLVTAEDEVRAALGEEDALLKIRKFAGTLATEIRGCGFQLDDNFYPPKVVWVGAMPGDEMPHAPRAELSAIEAALASRASAQAKLELASEQLGTALAAHSALQEECAAFIAPSADEVVELSDMEKSAKFELAAAQGRIMRLQSEITEAEATFANAKALWDVHAARVADAERVIAQCKSDLASLSFNNALVKKLRTIRPVVANKVWAVVLSSVSVMFSQIRGETSVITKETSGFRCNGQAVESLSGSTLDALGLALRVALLRTFVPHCSLLVLDEPFAACDAGRVASMLGFIRAVEMGQTILVTHEDVSESVANAIIEL